MRVTMVPTHSWRHHDGNCACALDYHRIRRRERSRSRRPRRWPTSATCRSPTRPGVAVRLHGDRGRSAGGGAAYTARANLVAVITNGTAVLGLGNIGALAGKPVMEGKACLFKKFAGIDVFDIEIDETDPDKLIDIVAALEPTFGGINLEDIKAPECFYIEKKLRERMKIPVFHDDQHGTAIVAAAADPERLEASSARTSREVKLVCSGAGAAALACLDLHREPGAAKLQNIFVTDSNGRGLQGPQGAMDPDKARYAQDTAARTLAEIIGGRRHLPGPVGRRRAHSPTWSSRWRTRPIILAMANPEPEIRPEDAQGGAARLPSSAPAAPTIRTRSTTSLCFPFIFRGALDVRRHDDQRGDEARRRARHRRAGARRDPPRSWRWPTARRRCASARDYLIPQAVRSAADRRSRAGGGARRRWTAAWRRGRSRTSTAYRERLSRFVYQSGHAAWSRCSRRPSATPKRVVYAEGEDERVLRAAQVVVDEGLARPVLVGRPDVIAARIEKLGLRLELGAQLRGCQPARRPALSRRRPSTTSWRGATAYRARWRRRRCAAAADADRRDAAAARRCRRDAVRHARRLRAITSSTCAT